MAVERMVVEDPNPVPDGKPNFVSKFALRHKETISLYIIKFIHICVDNIILNEMHYLNFNNKKHLNQNINKLFDTNFDRYN